MRAARPHTAPTALDVPPVQALAHVGGASAAPPAPRVATAPAAQRGAPGDAGRTHARPPTRHEAARNLRVHGKGAARESRRCLGIGRVGSRAPSMAERMRLRKARSRQTGEGRQEIKRMAGGKRRVAQGRPKAVHVVPYHV